MAAWPKRSPIAYGLLSLVLLGSSAQAEPRVAAARQVLLVVTDGWEAPRGTLYRFERSSLKAPFRSVGSPLPVYVGRTGLAWRSDVGAPAPPVAGPAKREGDGKSPAGVLSLLEMWGYAEAAPAGVRLPYRQSGALDRCVDDVKAKEYGTIVRAPESGPPPWQSAEELRMRSDHYKYLVVIDYNARTPRPGAGSCIFLHVAPPPGAPTAGCTALAEAELLSVLRFLDPAAQPVLVQLPRPALPAARRAWDLPKELREPVE